MARATTRRRTRAMALTGSFALEPIGQVGNVDVVRSSWRVRLGLKSK